MITNPPSKSTEVLPTLLKVREVARILSLSRYCVHALIESGDLEASQLNPSRRKLKRIHVRITRESLEKFYKKRFGHDLERALQNPFPN